MSALDIIDKVPEFAYLVALELKKISSPMEDAITQNEAFRIYGRAWVERQVERGRLSPCYHGSRKMYSRAELERVKAKENAVARLK